MRRILQLNSILKRPLFWVQVKFTRQQFQVIAAVLIGITAGLAAIVLKTSVHYLTRLFKTDFHQSLNHYAIYLLPLVGLALTVWVVKRFFKGNMGRGVAQILYEIAQRSSLVPRVKMYSQIITSAITVGFGGSVGLEAPIVVTGSAIGSNFGKAYKVGYIDRTLMLACGASAGIAAVFNSPVAGILFSIEVLLSDIVISAFIPLMVAAVSGSLVSRILLDEQILFHFSLQQKFDYYNVPCYILLGFLCGFASLYYARIVHAIERLFKPMQNKPWLRVLIGGLLLGALCLVFPPLFGEGYSSIKILASDNPLALLEQSLFSNYKDSITAWLLFLLALCLMKVVAVTVTFSAGGNGGNFAPGMFVGAFLGCWFSTLVNATGIASLPVSNFTMVGMAGMITGIMYAPLTGIFLIAEVTGGYDLIIPLMIVAALSYFLVRHFEPHSMDTRALAQMGKIFTHNRDRNILSKLSVKDLVDTDFPVVYPGASLTDLVSIVKSSKRNLFAVVDAANHKLLGVITLDDVKDVIFDQSRYQEVNMQALMKSPPVVLDINEDMRHIMYKFDSTGSWNLPVTQEGRFFGFISKSAVLNSYREQLLRTLPESTE